MNFLSKSFNYFIVSAQELSFKRAASKLFITPSPLGKVIFDLESNLGYELFIRCHNGLKMTKEGQELYDILIPFFHEIKSVENMLCQKNRKIELNNVKIGVGCYYFSGLSNFIADSLINKRQSFDVSILNECDAESAIKMKVIDVFISTSKILSKKSISERKLPNEKMMIAYSENVKNKNKDVVNIINGSAWAQLRHSEKQPYHQFLNDYISDFGFKSEIISLPDISQVINLIKQGIAISLVPESVGNIPLWKNNDIKLLSIPELDIEVEKYIYYLNRRGNELKKLVDDLYKHLSCKI